MGYLRNFCISLKKVSKNTPNDTISAYWRIMRKSPPELCSWHLNWGYLGLRSVKGCQMDTRLSAHVVSRTGSCFQLKQRVAKFLKFWKFTGYYLTGQYSARERNMPEMCKKQEISNLIKIRSIGPKLTIQKKLWLKNSNCFHFRSPNIDLTTWVHGKSI